MKLQRGKFIIKSINDLSSIPEEQDGIKKIIDLEYMGKFEYEGNAIPTSRMFVEYYKDDYSFYPTHTFNKDGQQMYIYANSNLFNDKLKENPSFISDLVKINININFSLWEYINNTPENCSCDLWWSIEGDYFILFGEENKKIIKFFINECYKRDGGEEEIKRKLLKLGYKI